MSDSCDRAIVPVAPLPAQRQLSIKEMMLLARAAEASGDFRSLSTAQALLRMQMGQELGLGPAASLRAIYVPEGSSCPAFSGNFVASRIKMSGRYDYRFVRHDEKGCDIHILRRVDSPRTGLPVWEDMGSSAFLEADAKRANLLKPNSAWAKYPKAMYFNRAITQAVRWYCPEVMMGFVAYTPEELGGEPLPDDIPEAEVVAIAPPPANDGALLDRLVEEKKADKQAILTHFKVATWAELSPAQYSKVLNTLQGR